MLSCVLVLVLTVVNAVAAFEIWSAPMQPGWPTVLAVVNTNNQRLNGPNYSWKFPTDDSTPVCTVNGSMNVACSGVVLDHVFSRTGNHTVQVTITDSALSASQTITASVVIKDLREFPVVGRPEIRQLDDAHWNRTVNGLYYLMDLGVYSHLARIHVMSLQTNTDPNSLRNAAHASPSFLPWHRVFMRVAEVCMQVAVNDSTYGLPYFEWQRGWTGVESYIGPTGNPSTYIVESGPFCNDPAQNPSANCPKRWVPPSDFPDSVKAIRRKYGNYTNFHFQTASEYNALMSIPVYDSAPFNDKSVTNSFRSALEGWVQGGAYGYTHNPLHMWVGGTMGPTSTSFYEPFFLFHHTEADNVFTQWQKKYQCTDGRANSVCYHPVAGEAVVPGGLYTDRMYPWGIQISEALKAEAGYHFLGWNEKPAPITTEPPPPLVNGNSDSGSGSIHVSYLSFVALLASMWFIV